MSGKLKLGFIGGSIYSAVGYAHYAACRMDNKWEIFAGSFSKDKAINLETANAYGLDKSRLFHDWRKMVSELVSELDAVVILTPTPLHNEIILVCIKLGIPIICEKALVENSDDALVIKNMLKKYKSFLAVTYNYSGYPIIRELRDKINNGILGDILHFQAEMPQEGYLKYDSTGKSPVPQQWRLVDKSIPALHLDLGVHLHQLIGYLTGLSPKEVISSQSTFSNLSVIDNVNTICHYDGGMVGNMFFSKSSLGCRNGLKIRIFGSKASAEWYQMNPEEIMICHNNGRREILDRAVDSKVASLKKYERFKAGHPAGYVEAFANLYNDIALCLKEYHENGEWASSEVYSVDFALEGLLMLEAMVRSFGSKSWEAVIMNGGNNVKG